MTREDEHRFKTVLLQISTLYDKPICDILATIWKKDLEDQEMGDIEIAFDLYRRGEKKSFMPKPGDLLEIINGRPRDNAVIQWGHVMAKAKHASNGMTFNDPITAKVVKSMGGVDLGMYTASEWAHSRNYFIDSYIAHQNQQEIDIATKKQRLISNNQQNGITHER